MNTNKYEFDSTDEMLQLPDFHFDQNVPVQGPEAQALEAQGPENQAPEALQLADQGSVMPSTAQLQEGKSSADINIDQNNPDQAPCVIRTSDGPVVTEWSDDSSQAITQLLMVGMSAADANNAMMDETLAKSALSDPITVKRTWESRQSAARSKKRRAEDQAKLETRVKTLQTERAALVDREAWWKNAVDELKHENTKLRSMVEDIEQKKLLLDLQNADLRIKAGQGHPNSGPPGMMMPFGVPHNNYAQTSGPPGMMMPFGVPHNNYALTSGPPGMMMPFGVPHNDFAPNLNQQAAQAHARMQQQQQSRLVPPSQTNVASGEGADGAGSDAGGGDDAPGQGS